MLSYMQAQPMLKPTPECTVCAVLHCAGHQKAMTRQWQPPNTTTGSHPTLLLACRLHTLHIALLKRVTYFMQDPRRQLLHLQEVWELRCRCKRHSGCNCSS